MINKLTIFILLLFSINTYAGEAKRIVALAPHSVEMLFAIGAGDRIIATVEHADYPEKALDILRIGNYTGIQIEKLVAIKPDLIIAWKSGNKLADLKKIESLGLNIIYSNPENIEDINQELLQLGKLTGLIDNAKQVVKQIREKHQKIKLRYIEKKQVSTFYQLWHDPLRTVGSGSWIESLINDCHGKNIFSDSEVAYPIVSLESVLIKNPQVIIIPHHSGSATKKDEFWDKWTTVDAVKHQRVFSLNGDLLHRFTPRAIDGLAALCQAIDSAR